MKTVILCGGRGLRFGNDEIPKPMQLVGGRPLLWHIMQWYAKHGHNELVLCLGWKGDVIRKWVKEQEADGVLDNMTEVQCVDTGLETQTGGRLYRVADLLGKEFMVTYGDCVGDVDLNALLSFHRNKADGTCTITTYRPTIQFGVVSHNWRNKVVSFEERPRSTKWCNAGFMVMSTDAISHILGDIPLEKALQSMASKGELWDYEHHGFWKGCDTEKDRRELDDLWNAGNAPWRV